MNRTLWIVQGLLAALFLFGGIVKLTMSPEDLAAAKKVVAATVVPNWAKRCGEACTKEWLATVGKVVGIESIGN